jgi:hypothetical protein
VKLPHISTKKRPPLGTVFSFVLNEQASVSFAFTHSVDGRTANGHCAARTTKNRHKPSCKRSVTAGTLSFTGHSGLNKVSFHGRISAAQTLRPGRYTLVIVASASGKSSPPAKLSFTRLPGRRPEQQ